MRKRSLVKNAVQFILMLIIGLTGFSTGQAVLDVKIAFPNDDAEELVGESVVGPAGSAYLDSSDLELVDDAETTQIVGLRFMGVELDPSTTVMRAYVQFTVDEATSDPASLNIYGEASDNAAAFSETANTLSSRTPTTLKVAWSPAPWLEPGDAGEAQQTPDLSGVIQEIINQPGWQRGNALVIMLSGEGKRVAESFDGSSSGAAVLHIEYESSETQAETPDAAAEVEAEDVAEGATETADLSEGAESATSEPEISVPESSTETEMAQPQEAVVQPRDPASGRRYALTGESVNGSVLVTDYGNGTVILTVLVNGQSSTDVYGARLNLGSCNAPGTLLLDLEPVRGDRGSLSVTSSQVDFATLTEADLNLTLLPTPDSNEVIACGEVGAP